MQIALIKLKYHTNRRMTEARRYLFHNNNIIYINCPWLMNILGGYSTPLVSKDLVVFWIDNRIKSYVPGELNIYLSKAPDTYEIPAYMSIVWCTPIFGDEHYIPSILLQNIIFLLGDPNKPGHGWPWIPGYLKIYETELFDKTVLLKYKGADREMNKFVVIIDYTFLDIKTQLKIYQTIIKWHAYCKKEIGIYKHNGIAIFISDVTDDQIYNFIEDNFLKGYIWFIKGKWNTKTFLNDVMTIGCSLVDVNMSIYDSEEFEDMIKRVKEMKMKE